MLSDLSENEKRIQELSQELGDCLYQRARPLVNKKEERC